MDTTRRRFIKQAGFVTGALLLNKPLQATVEKRKKRPNVVFVFADQWRAQDTGYAGNKDVFTRNIDALAAESINFHYAVSCMPVSTPFRASLLTGQYSLTHGLFLNDLPLDADAVTIGKVYKTAGYDTGYIGKWHVNGGGRSAYIPEERRHGFDFFKVLECTHDYMRSPYYDNNNPQKKIWNGYDAFDQTREAQNYICNHAGKEKPFVLFLSWGPPHNPYEAVPQQYLDLYKDRSITLRENVPDDKKDAAIRDLKGYYAHIAALDECVGDLQKTIRDAGIENDTIFIFTSDHGDMLGSQGMQRKQKPYDESILVPFLLKYPALLGKQGRTVDTIINSPDIMPTLLGLSGLSIPDTVEGNNLAPIICGKKKDDTKAALIECIAPFGEWERKDGGKEYRGIRTRQYTYVRDLNGPWLLYDNREDPFQLKNQADNPEYNTVREELDNLLSDLLHERRDEFLPGSEYIKQRGYTVGKGGTVEFTW